MIEPHELAKVEGGTVVLAGLRLTPGGARRLGVQLRRLAAEAAENAERAEAEHAARIEVQLREDTHPVVCLAADFAGVPLSAILTRRGPRSGSAVAQLVAWTLRELDGASYARIGDTLNRSARQAAWMVQQWPRRVRANPDLAQLSKTFARELTRARIEGIEQLCLTN